MAVDRSREAGQLRAGSDVNGHLKVPTGETAHPCTSSRTAPGRAVSLSPTLASCCRVGENRRCALLCEAHPPGTLRVRWPTWLAIGLAAVVGLDLSDGVALTPILPAAAIIYLAAAARRPSAAWPLFLGALLVIGASEALGSNRDATWSS